VLPDPPEAGSADRASIESLLVSYGELVDEARVDELGALFTPDAILDYGRGRQCPGRDEVVAFITGRLRLYRATSHHLTNVRVTVTGPDTATATTHVYAWHERHGGDQAEIWGRYLDELVRTEAGWRIALRRIRTAGQRGFALAPGEPSPFEPIARRELP
jgi:ketosteroid isomerase-like protein